MTSNQNVWFQPIKIVLFGSVKLWEFRVLVCIERDQWATREEPSLYRSQFPLWPSGVHYWRLSLAWAASLELLHLGHFTWKKILSSPHLRWGLLLVLKLWQQSLVSIKWWYLKWHANLSPDTTLKPMPQHLHKDLELSCFPWWYWKVSDKSSKINNLPYFQLRSQRLYSV